MSNLPEVNMEDRPPLLRFEKSTEEDRDKSIEEGRFMYRDVDMVYVKAHGDNKSEVPYKVPGWLKGLQDRLRNRLISQDYHDFCVKSYKRWQENGEVPIDGTPIAGRVRQVRYEAADQAWSYT